MSKDVQVPPTQLQGIALAALSRANADFSNAAQAVSQAAAQTTDSVSLSTAAVGLLQAKTSYETALVLAETVDEIAQQSIDVLA